MNQKNIKPASFLLVLLLSSEVFALNTPDNSQFQVAQNNIAAPLNLPVSQAQVQARDGSFMLTLPVGWVKTAILPGTNATVQLNVANFSKDISVSVSTANTADIQDMEAWSRGLQARLAATLTLSTSTPFQRIKVNGFDGLRAEVAGVQNGARFHYLLTVLRGDKCVVYFLSSAFESQFSASRSDFEQVVNGIQF